MKLLQFGLAIGFWILVVGIILVYGTSAKVWYAGSTDYEHLIAIDGK